MKSLSIFAAVIALAGCAATTDAATDSSADLSSAPATTAIADATPLTNESFQTLRAYWTATTFEYADIQTTTAFSFEKKSSMNDADALVLAKAIGKSANYKEVKAYTLNAVGTPTELANLAATLEHEIRADGDTAHTPTLTTDMIAAFSLPDHTPGGAIRVFTAIGPGDDHDGDNQDREAIFLDVDSGEALVLQGQSIDM